MGQKTHPTSFRLGYIYNWKSAWFHKEKYADYLLEDIKLRKLLLKHLRDAAVARVQIERSEKETRINIYTSRPGVIIGRGGSGIEDIKALLKKKINAQAEYKINIEEVREPNANARLVGLQMAEQLEKRVPFRKVMKQTLDRCINTPGVEGVRLMVAGRLNGADMSRREWLAEGRMPLHTLRADIDFARVEANTTYGVLGLKVWIYRGEVFDQEQSQQGGQNQSKKPSQKHSLNVK